MYFNYTFIIGILLVIIIYFYYQQISHQIYMKKLEEEFYNLQKLGLNVFNPNMDSIIKGKKVTGSQVLSRKYLNSFRNGNTIMLHNNKIIIVDVDTPKSDSISKSDFILEKMPKDTVITKSPNGYHFYFYNDLGITLNSYTYIKIDDIRYALDILDNKTSNITVPPSVVNGKEYKWINSPYENKMVPLSKYYDLIKYLIDSTSPLKLRFINVTGFIKPGIELYIVWHHEKYMIELYKYIISQSNLESSLLYQDDNLIFYKIKEKYFLFMKEDLVYKNRLFILSKIKYFCEKYNIHKINEIEFIDNGNDDNDDIEENTKYLKGKYNSSLVLNKNRRFILDSLNKKYYIQSNNYYPNNYTNRNGNNPNGWMNDMHKHILNDIFYYNVET